MTPKEKQAIEQRHEALGEVLQILTNNPRFNYLIPGSTYYKTYRKNLNKAPSAVTRWHSLSVDWRLPFTSVWKAMWHVSPTVSDSEYLELRSLVREYDQNLREHYNNLPAGKLLRELIIKLKEPI